MRTIRASEIGTFLFCERAWWYQNQGIASENVRELASGTALHYKHGRSVMAAGCLRTVAVILFLGALVAAVMYWTSQLV